MLLVTYVGSQYSVADSATPKKTWTEFEVDDEKVRGSDETAARELGLPPFRRFTVNFDDAVKLKNVAGAMEAVEQTIELGPKNSLNWSYLAWTLDEKVVPIARTEEEEYAVLQLAAKTILRGVRKFPDDTECLFSATIVFGNLFKNSKWRHQARFGQDHELESEVRTLVNIENCRNYLGRMNHHLVAAELARKLCELLDSMKPRPVDFPATSRYAIATKESFYYRDYIKSIEKDLAPDTVVVEASQQLMNSWDIFKRRVFMHKGVRFRHQDFIEGASGSWSWREGAIIATERFDLEEAEEIASEYIENTSFQYWDQYDRVEYKPSIIRAKIELYRVRNGVEDWLDEKLDHSETLQLFEDIEASVNFWQDMQRQHGFYKEDGVVSGTISKLVEILELANLEGN